MEMSFLGCIGHLMAGSGLQELLQIIYAENAVRHMLTVKAISKALRGQLLVVAALNTMLTANAFNIPIPTSLQSEHDSQEADRQSEDNQIQSDLQVAADSLSEAQKLLNQLLTKESDAEEISSSECLKRIMTNIQAEEKESVSGNRTAQLASVSWDGGHSADVH